jgi:hypothetical protein
VHNWGAWTLTKAPSEAEEGEEVRTCSYNSAHRETRAVRLNALGTYTTVAALQTALGNLAANTPDTWRTVNVNINGTAPNNISNLKTALLANQNKYIKLIFTGSNTNSITDIPSDAFRNCTGLVSVTLPNNVNSIGSSAFENCTSLASVTIPNGVNSIGSSTFLNCYKLASITIPDSVTSIAAQAFAFCVSLTEINVGPSNTAYSSQDGVLYNKDKTNLHSYPGGKASAFTIPDNVTEIGNSAFMGSSSITNVTIPNSVTRIGDNAFRSCNYLSSVTIPSSVTNVGNGSFAGCTRLTAINVNTSNSTYTSYNGVLYNKDRTTLVNYPDGRGTSAFTIPNGVTKIGNSSFYLCSTLTSVTIPGSVTFIDGSAFRSCENLASVTIPGSVENIGDYAFGSYALTSVTFQGNIPSSGMSTNRPFLGDLRDKFYAADATKGTPGTYTTANPSYDAVWTKQ